jgi:CBS domain-containing protein/sporulation protein YlmC with PRC-barrel domain
MVFISELIGKPVTDIDGKRIGSFKDFIVQTGKIPHPHVTSMLVKRGKKVFAIPPADIVILTAPGIPVRKQIGEIEVYQPVSGDLYLVQDVLDKQIIDVNGIRVVRVNDLELTTVNGDIYVSNVDVGSSGIMRRLGLARMLSWVEGSKQYRPTYISWDNVELLDGGPLRLRVPGQGLSDLHPADLAEILSDLSHVESGRILDSLDVESIAETLEEVEPEFQASLIEHLDDERIADVLEEMSPDEAADLLAELPDERGEELLNLMESEEAEDVRRLLAYPEDSAGGIMNTEYIGVSANLTVEQVMEHLRQNAHEAETIYYMYVLNNEGRLDGVFSLRQLVMTQPGTVVADIMETRVVTVSLLEQQEEVAHQISKYNLLALPVVDEDGRMQGIVTADDALDKIIPTAWKKRLPRFYQ